MEHLCDEIIPRDKESYHSGFGQNLKHCNSALQSRLLLYMNDPMGESSNKINIQEDRKYKFQYM